MASSPVTAPKPSRHVLRLLAVRVLRRASRHLLLDGHYMAIFHFGQLTIELTQWSWLGFFHQISVVLLGAALGVERHLQRAIAGADLARLWSGKKIHLLQPGHFNQLNQIF